MKTFGFVCVCLLVISIISILSAALHSYIITFYMPKRKEDKLYKLPEGEQYEKELSNIKKWVEELLALPCEEVWIESHDGLKLYGRYYHVADGAPVQIMFHGYRGSAERDLSGGIQRCFALGRNVLLVDQRTSCGSEGNVISFGINEHRDCLAWIDFAVNHFGPDVKLVLTGISMGASTVLMAAGKPLTENVVGVLADCGFSSPKEIIQKCAKDMHLPAKLIYPFIKLGAKIYGHFDLEEYSPLEAMKICKVPVIFFHGEDDAFVPCDMSREMYEACSSPKKLVTIPNAGHGLVYLVDNEKYFQSVIEFFSENGVETKLVK